MLLANNSLNWGTCTGPLCRNYSNRCSYDMCVVCCRKLHTGVDLKDHVDGSSSSFPERQSAVNNSQLPAIYKPKPVVPEPTEMEELTEESNGDWMLRAEKTYGGYV